jgi:outer membrane protein TolC
MRTFEKHEKISRRRKEVISVFLLFFFISVLSHFSYAEILTLSEGIKLAAENSRMVKITEHEESISEAESLLARSSMLPNVNASLNHTSLAHQPATLFGLQTVHMSEKDFFSYGLSIQQTLYDFKGNSSRYKASKAILNTKKLDTKRIRNLIALEFILLYFDLLEAEKTVLVAQKEVERLELHHRDARHLYEEGVITKNDLLQAEVQISDARQRLLSAKNNRSLLAARLNTLLARPLTTEIEVLDIEGVFSDMLDMDLIKAWEFTEQHRPEIAIVDETLRYLDLEKTSKQSEYFPTFFVKGGYDFTENRYQVHEGNWSLVLGMNINLFKGGSTRAEVMKIENQKSQLLEQRKKLLDDIKLEVEKYLLDMKNARERITVTKDAVQQAEENLRINRLKYEEGVGTATDVIDAVTFLTRQLHKNCRKTVINCSLANFMF